MVARSPVTRWSEHGEQTVQYSTVQYSALTVSDEGVIGDLSPILM